MINFYLYNSKIVIFIKCHGLKLIPFNYDKKNIKHYKESIFYENYINDIKWDILHLSFNHKSLNEIIFLKIFSKKNYL